MKEYDVEAVVDVTVEAENKEEAMEIVEGMFDSNVSVDITKVEPTYKESS